ncbi:MAG TPA: hypothetical protein VGO59_16505 [Verrucomicrobiae bacterium]
MQQEEEEKYSRRRKTNFFVGAELFSCPRWRIKAAFHPPRPTENLREIPGVEFYDLHYHQIMVLSCHVALQRVFFFGAFGGFFHENI